MRSVQAWILSPLSVAAHVGSNFCGESLLLTLLVQGAPGIGCQIFGPLLPQVFPLAHVHAPSPLAVVGGSCFCLICFSLQVFTPYFLSTSICPCSLCSGILCCAVHTVPFCLCFYCLHEQCSLSAVSIILFKVLNGSAVVVFIMDVLWDPQWSLHFFTSRYVLQTRHKVFLLCYSATRGVVV